MPASNKEVALYCHIPFCVKKCKYCDFFSCAIGKEKISDQYISALLKEALCRKKKFGISSWKTVYVGGGTPSLLLPSQIKTLVSKLIEISDSRPEEITVEMNPQDVSEEFLEALKDCGVNRISVGFQSFDDFVLEKIGRRGSKKENFDCLKLIEKCWKGRFSADLIAGLPYQTKESFCQDLSILLENPKVDHISMYMLCVEEETPLFREIEEKKLPFDDDFSLELFEEGRKILKKNGFIQYEVSNFARKSQSDTQDFINNSGHHNSIYWNQESYCAVGSGGCGTIYCFDENEKKANGFRWTNKCDVENYLDFWRKKENCFDTEIDSFSLDEIQETENLDEDVLRFEYLMMGLRKCCCGFEGKNNCGVSEKLYKNRFKKDLFSDLKKAIAALPEENYIVFDSGDSRRFALTEKGILFLNDFLEKV